MAAELLLAPLHGEALNIVSFQVKQCDVRQVI